MDSRKGLGNKSLEHLVVPEKRKCFIKKKTQVNQKGIGGNHRELLGATTNPSKHTKAAQLDSHPLGRLKAHKSMLTRQRGREGHMLT